MPKDDADHRPATEHLMERDGRAEWSHAEWERGADAIAFLNAAGFTREGSARALPATLALSAASNMDLGRATRVATEMMILMRKVEYASLNHCITFVP